MNWSNKFLPSLSLFLHVIFFGVGFFVFLFTQNVLLGSTLSLLAVLDYGILLRKIWVGEVEAETILPQLVGVSIFPVLFVGSVISPSKLTHQLVVVVLVLIGSIMLLFPIKLQVDRTHKVLNPSITLPDETVLQKIDDLDDNGILDLETKTNADLQADNAKYLLQIPVSESEVIVTTYSSIDACIDSLVANNVETELRNCGFTCGRCTESNPIQVSQDCWYTYTQETRVFGTVQDIHPICEPCKEEVATQLIEDDTQSILTKERIVTTKI